MTEQRTLGTVKQEYDRGDLTLSEFIEHCGNKLMEEDAAYGFTETEFNLRNEEYKRYMMNYTPTQKTENSPYTEYQEGNLSKANFTKLCHEILFDVSETSSLSAHQYATMEDEFDTLMKTYSPK